jgi:hypothetical protein
VAIAYVLHKTPYVFPIIGGRKLEQMEQNIKGLDISLTDEQMKFLESEAPEFDVGFPNNLVVGHSSFLPVVPSFNARHLIFRETEQSNLCY